MKIQLYGTGCANCRRAEKVIREALATTGVDAELEKVEDVQAILAAGVLGTPAVAVDGVMKISGRVPGPGDVAAWLGG